MCHKQKNITLVFCSNLDCGAPHTQISLGQPPAKKRRPMNYMHSSIGHLKVHYQCPVCGEEAIFKKRL